MADSMVKIACWLYSLKHRKEWSGARPLEGNAGHMGADEKYWWGYKYYFGPIEDEEPGSGLERFFHDQDLDLDPRDGFVEETGMTFCAGGDILAHPGLNPGTTRNIWDDVRDFYFSGDIAYANLETPVASSLPPSYIPKSILVASAMNNTPGMFDRLVDGGRGINLFSTANNHCLDQGEAGLRETLDFLDAKGYPHVGTARSPEERDRVMMVERNGVKAAFISFTSSLNWSGLPEGKEYLANHVRLNKPGSDLSPIEKQVKAAKAAGADIVIAFLHWSLEFESFPARNIVDMGHALIELGVDVIIGNHPHNVQPVERHRYLDNTTGQEKEGLILYALGDLLSIHRTLPNSRLACLARLRISKGKAGGKECTRVGSLDMLPVYLHVRKKKGECTDYRVLDFRKLAGELRSGIDRYMLGCIKTQEVFRLEALMHRVLHAALK